MTHEEQIECLKALLHDFIITGSAVRDSYKPTKAEIDALSQCVTNASAVLSEPPFGVDHFADEQQDAPVPSGTLSPSGTDGGGGKAGG